MRKRSLLLKVTAVCVATIAMAPSAHATVGPLEANMVKLEGAAPADVALPIIRGGFGGAAEGYGVAHG